jgi:YidC/Oxa1 family membrane protein insertase
MNFISAFLKDVLDLINSVVGNYGWSVILFTLLIRLVLLPLDIKSRRSMMRMNEVQPQIAALQKKYANDKEKLNVKMSELYKKEKINPLSGCLPMMIQLPILFMMFTAMRVVANEHTVKLIQAMMSGTFTPDMLQPFLWIKSIYQPDSFLSTIIPAIGDQLQNIQEVAGTILTADNLASVRQFLGSDAYKTIAAQFAPAPRFPDQDAVLGHQHSRAVQRLVHPADPGRRQPDDQLQAAHPGNASAAPATTRSSRPTR